MDILKSVGIERPKIFKDCPRAFYIERALQMGQGLLSKDGALCVTTGSHTGRSANDRYIVKTQTTQESIWWENNLNEMSQSDFKKLKESVVQYLNEQNELYVTERSVGASDKNNLGAFLISTHPQHALFSQHLFRDKQREMTPSDFVIFHAPEMKIVPSEFGLKRETAVVTCFESNTTIIVGTLYAGEIKKSMFSAMNFILPPQGILPMHAGASRLTNKETSVFFGLSGTGKTTLSTDEGVYLIGDDEHGLSDEGIFNFEGGCYAKTHKLSYETEPEIWNATNRFGSMMENVKMDAQSRTIDFNDESITENGRSSYPLDHIEELEKSGKGQMPKHIFFLTADAFGVLPPIAKLSKQQAMFYFVLGYTAKLAGTEVGVVSPQATFSPCFGAPFMLRNPAEYAHLLGDFLDRHSTQVWLVNTGWTQGPYGEGKRFPLDVTRKIIRAVQANVLTETRTEKDPIFGLETPLEIEGVNQQLLTPQKTWSDQAAYVLQAKKLAASFHQQMQKFPEFYRKNSEAAPLYNGK